MKSGILGYLGTVFHISCPSYQIWPLWGDIPVQIPVLGSSFAQTQKPLHFRPQWLVNERHCNDRNFQGVESEKCPSFTKALENKAPIYTPNQATLADGLAVPQVGYNAFATTVPLLDKMIVVKEEWIALAILRLVELEKCVVEGAGASGLAAILAGHLDEFKGKR